MKVGMFISSYRYSVLLLLAIVYLSLVLNPATLPDKASHLSDKWAHIGMYFVFSAVVWYEYSRNHRKQTSLVRAWLVACLMPMLVGGAMELGQKYLTSYRGADWLDACANAIGAVAASVLASASILAYRRRKGNGK